MKRWLQLPLAVRSMANQRPLELESWIRDVGHQRTRHPEYRVSGSNVALPRVSLQYTLRGEGALEHRSGHHRLESGSLLIVNAPSEYVYCTPPGQEWEFLYITLEGPVAERLGRRIEALAGPVLRLQPEDPALTLFLAQAKRILSGEVLDAWQNSEEAYALLMRLLRHGAAQPSRRKEVEDALIRAVELARRSASDPEVDVNTLAACANLSRFHFCRLFKAHTGVPPGEFLLQERLHRAAGLLQMTGHPVRLIAQRCGFPDPVHFGKIFRRRIGLSPQAYRLCNRDIRASESADRGGE